MAIWCFLSLSSLWLVTPPPSSTSFCFFFFVVFLVNSRRHLQRLLLHCYPSTLYGGLAKYHHQCPLGSVSNCLWQCMLTCDFRWRMIKQAVLVKGETKEKLRYGRSTYVNSSTLMEEQPLPGHQCPLGVAHSAIENILTCAITTPCNNEGCASSSLLAVPQPQNRQSWAGRIWLLCWQSCRWTRSLDLLVRNSTRHYPVGFCSNRSKSRMGGQGPPATGV